MSLERFRMSSLADKHAKGATATLPEKKGKKAEKVEKVKAVKQTKKHK